MSRSGPKTSELTISVVIPTLNEQARIRTTLASVLANIPHFSSFEIIVADSGSVDHTEAEVSQSQIDALALGIRLRFVKASEKGPAIARNTGANIAEGKYLFFLDADTLVDPTFLKVNLERMQAKKLTVGGVYMKSDSNKLIDNLLVGMLNGALSLMQYTSRVGAFGAALFFERAIFCNMNGFDPHIHFGEDIDLIQRTVKQGHLFRMLPTSVITSARRAEKYGRWNLLRQTVRLAVHLLLHKTTKGSGIDYEFGNYDN